MPPACTNTARPRSGSAGPAATSAACKLRFPLAWFRCGRPPPTVEHLQIRFDAQGALRAWVDSKLEPLRVPKAEAWRASREGDIERSQAVQLSYDWCAFAE